jgi:tetratricopeptide (TPR) repeat protein
MKRSLYLELFAYVLAACVPLTASGCSLRRMAVDTTASVLAEGDGVARGYFDWESAGHATPAGIIQFEGMHVISPDNEELTLMIVKAYMAYAYGWIMDAYEVAQARGDFEEAEHHKQRAFLMYSRARDLALSALEKRDEGIRQALTKSPKELGEYLKKFDDDDKPVLFWLMMSWTSAINNSPHTEDLADMAELRVIASWVIERDPGYEDAGALVFLGGFESSMPKAFGGDPAKGKQYFERALELTQRKNHIVLTNYAMLYAVNAPDRALFVSLMREIVEAPDQGAPYRLSNKVSRRRAVRALKRVDELFYD